MSLEVLKEALRQRALRHAEQETVKYGHLPMFCFTFTDPIPEHIYIKCEGDDRSFCNTRSSYVLVLYYGGVERKETEYRMWFQCDLCSFFNTALEVYEEVVKLKEEMKLRKIAEKENIKPDNCPNCGKTLSFLEMDDIKHDWKGDRDGDDRCEECIEKEVREMYEMELKHTWAEWEQWNDEL